MSLYTNILKHSGVYSISVVFSRLASILLLPLYTRYLTPADYGVMELLDLTTSVATILVGLHLSDAFLYYYSAAKTADNRERILITALFGAAGLASLITIPIWLLTPGLSDLVLQTSAYSGLFRLTFCSLLFLFPQEVATAYLRFRNDSALLVKLQILRLCLSIALNIVLLVYFRLGIAAMLYSQFAGNAFLAACAGYSALRHVKRWQWDYRVFFQLFRYALPLGFGGLAVMVVNFGDRFVLQRNVTVAQIGIYSLAYKIGMLVGQLEWLFFTYWKAQMYTLVRQPDGDLIFGRVTTYYTLVLSCGALALSAFAYPIVRLLATPAYIEAARFIPFVAVAYLIKAWGDQVQTLLLVERRPGAVARITYTGSAVCLAGYFILIPAFELHGALAATLAAFVVMAIHSASEVRRLRLLPVEWKRLAILGAAFAAALAFGCLPRRTNLPLALVVGTASLLLFGFILMRARFFYAHELETIQSMVGSAISFARAQRQSKADPAKVTSD